MKILVVFCLLFGYCAAGCGNSTRPPWGTTRPPWWGTTRPPWWNTTIPPWWNSTSPPYGTTRPPSRPENGSCNCDDRPCSRFMRQDTNDDFDWTYHSYSTPSYKTGPSGDHTTGHGRYIYAEASYPRNRGDRARLTAHVSTQFQSCFSFYYHMFGEKMGTLRVYVDHKLAWELSGNQGNQWVKATIPLHSVGLIRFDFDAVIGASYTSDIALDDLGYQEYAYLTKGDCMITPSCAKPSMRPSSSPPTYPPWTTSYPHWTTSYPHWTTRPPMGNVSCGRPSVGHARVIGGKDAIPGSWPWQVGLYAWGMFLCGGSLVSPYWVVTAAHCIYPNVKYNIVLGDHVRNQTDGYEQKIDSSQIFVHPNYTKSNIDTDIALIKLSRPAFMNNRVKPVCMPSYQNGIAWPGKLCYITGWGKVKHPGNAHNILQQAKLPIVSQYECQRKLSADNSSNGLQITDNMICAGERNSIRGGCHGDSGGPLVCQLGYNGPWSLEGVVSWGSPQCNARQRYTVFARVDRFRDWIDHLMRYYK